MPKIYQIAEDVRPVLDAVLEKYHGDLVAHEVRIGLQYVVDTGAGVALKLHGWPCQAIVKVNSAEKRAEGAPDCTIFIDRENWKHLTEPERLALLDHECEHVKLRRDKKTGEVKRDDKDRPLLKLQPHDYEVTGFACVADRHKAASPEVLAAKVLRDKWGQLLWDFDEAPAPAPGRAKDAMIAIQAGAESLTMSDGELHRRTKRLVGGAAGGEPGRARA